MSYALRLCCLSLLLGLGACRPASIENIVSGRSGNLPDSVLVLPFDDFPPGMALRLCEELKPLLPGIRLADAAPLPASAYYAPRRRYRADSLLSFLGEKGKGRYRVIGLTSLDISTTKGKHADWGVLGLGERPGDACIVSTFRLSKRRLAAQLYKVAVHELGHTSGLPHCPEPSCYMRDAEGGNPLDSEEHFCTDCVGRLNKAGWHIGPRSFAHSFSNR